MAKKSREKKIFETELEILDRIQKELFEAIAQKPDARDIESVRIYLDNLFIVLNRTVTMVMDVRTSLEKKENNESITETYNSPA